MAIQTLLYKPTVNSNYLRMLFFAITIAWTSVHELFAQPRFTRTTFNSVYTPISIAGGATSSTATGNSANQTGIPIGFSFGYGDSTFSSIGLSTNGLVWFDAIAPSTSAVHTALVTTTSPNQSLSAWCSDLIDDASSDILYQLQGSPGSQTFTVQYTNYPTFTGTPGSNVRMNCQIILYEATNVIEFRYGTLNVTGAQTTAGGAMIGMEWGTGGNGDFIDAVTGSSSVSHRMLSPLSGWPSYNFRFTPGSPAVIPAGTYNVGVGQTYNSLTQAVADVNHRGINGAVALNLTDAQYDTTAANGRNIFPVFVATPNGTATNALTISKTGTPATLAYRGSSVSSSGAGFGTGVGTTAISHGNEPLLAVSASYTTISNLNLITHGSPQTVEIGLAQFELFGNVGAHHNFYDKISVDLDRTKGDVTGIWSFSTTSPGGLAGTNSFNTWRDISIRDCNVGFNLEGVNNATGPADQGNQIITSSCATYNYIGDPNVPDDISNDGTGYGIWVHGQNGFTVRNCIIQNITTTTTGTIDGLVVSNSLGSNEISNNIIRTIRRSSTGLNSGNFLCGIRVIWGNQTMSFRIFNNSISNLLTSYTGVPTAINAVKGISFNDTGAGSVAVELYNNSVSIDGSTFPNGSNLCLEITNAETYTIKNNVFANFTTGQTGVAQHIGFYTASANQYGSGTSLSDFNNYYIADAINGSAFRAATTNHTTQAAWQAAMTVNPNSDVNSQFANPNFVNNATDLHATATSNSLDETGTTVPAYITVDYDCQSRVAPHDIGFDDFTSGCAAPSAPTGNAAQSFCDSSNPTVASLSASGSNIQWYAMASGGSPLSASAPLVNNTHYYATQTVSACESVTRLDVTVTINSAPPSANVVVPPINNLPGSACNGTNVLNINVPAVPNATQYIWDGPAGTTFNGGANPYTAATPNADITFGNPNGSGYYIGVQASNACGTTLRKVQWVRGSLSTPVLSGPSIVCAGSSGNYAITNAPITGALTYTWSGPSGTMFDGNPTPYTSVNTNVTADLPVGFTSGSICVTANAGCVASAPKCIVVSTAPSSLGVMSGNFSVCPPGPSVYTVSNPGAVGGTYNWTLPANTSGSSTTDNISVTLNPGFSSGNISVTYTNICGVTSAPRTKSIVIATATVPASITTTTTNGLCGILASFSCPSQAGASFNWTFPGGSSPSTLTNTTNSVSSTMPGAPFNTGQVCVTATNACGTSGPRCITVKGPPLTPGITTSVPSGWCAPQEGVQFNGNISALTGVYNLSWTVIPSSAATYASGQNTSQYIVDWDNAGNASVNLTASNACGSATRTLSLNIPGCSRFGSADATITSDHKNVNVYPNPSDGIFNVEFNKAGTHYQLEITDLHGRSLMKQHVKEMSSYELDLTKFETGIYLMHIRSNEASQTLRLIKE